MAEVTTGLCALQVRSAHEARMQDDRRLGCLIPLLNCFQVRGFDVRITELNLLLCAVAGMGA